MDKSLLGGVYMLQKYPFPKQSLVCCLHDWDLNIMHVPGNGTWIPYISLQKILV